MSGRVSSGQAGRADLSSQAGARHRSARGRWAAGVVIVMAAGAVAAAAGGAFGSPGSPAAAGTAYHVSTAPVTRRSLASQTSVNATLGFAGSYSVAGSGQGTLTWLPAPGQVIRQGQVLYRTDNAVPVVLLYGTVPAWRALSAGMTGQDVAQLNRDLLKLGYATRAALGPFSGWDYFSAETAYALESLQDHLGLPVTGTLPLGQAVFEASALRVTTLDGSLGSAASGTVLAGTSDTPVVSIALNAAQQTEVKAGNRVAVTLPDGAVTPGLVSSVGTVASGSAGSATVPVHVSLIHPSAAAGLDQAPVTVTITTGSVADALVVPVDALLAQPNGGYAVETVTAGGRHRLVAVTPGLFDDAAGLVQVASAGLAAGQHVVVPAL
jgi:peptidoglycan hydrolase-like protein with peptidoglycan-binding domain